MPSPTERKLAAQIGANASWAQTADRTARTAPGLAAAEARFAAQVDPAGELTVEERARRAASARKAHYQRMTLASIRSRRKAAELIAAAEQAEAEIVAGGNL